MNIKLKEMLLVDVLLSELEQELLRGTAPLKSSKEILKATRLKIKPGKAPAGKRFAIPDWLSIAITLQS